MSTIIKGIECFGDMSETATVSILGEWNDGAGEFEEYYLGSKGFNTWGQLVSYYIAAGAEEGYTILEMESDE